MPGAHCRQRHKKESLSTVAGQFLVIRYKWYAVAPAWFTRNNDWETTAALTAIDKGEKEILLSEEPAVQ